MCLVTRLQDTVNERNAEVPSGGECSVRGMPWMLRGTMVLPNMGQGQNLAAAPSGRTGGVKTALRHIHVTAGKMSPL